MLENKLNRLFYEDRKNEQRYGLHASAVLGCLKDNFCYREQVLSLFYQMNQGEQLPVKQLKIFAQGNAMHEKWYSFTIDALVDFNKPFKDREPDEWICDVKSQSTFAFNKTRRHPSGEAQVNFYMWALSRWSKDRDGKKYKKGFVLVDSKDNQEIRPIPVHYDKEKVAPVIDCLKEIQIMKKKFIEEKEMPERICKKVDCKRASTCSMKDACWKCGIGRIKLPKELREQRIKNG